DWDEGPDVGGDFGPYRQSERQARYDEALRTLHERGLVYFCDCSRSEIAREASAPHPGEEGPRYSGRCREWGMRERDWKRSPAVRLAAPDRAVTVADRFQGEASENVWRSVGDFVLRRGDGIYAYQLAVVVDDLAMGVTEIVRGADLLSSAPRQALLAELLGRPSIPFAHHAMIVGEGGERLAKRARGVSLRDHREDGVRPEVIVGSIAVALGLVPDRGGPVALTPRELLAQFDTARLVGRLAAPVHLPGC